VPGYRWLFAGMFFVHAGRNLTVVAVPFQVFQLTGSILAVGLLGLAQLIPLLLVSVVGGALADAVDRRRLLVLSQVVLAGTAAGLLWNSMADTPAIWPLFVLSAVNAGVSAIDSPARHAIVPGLVGRALLPSALALNQTLTNIAKAGLPAVAGLLIATAGFPFSYGVETLMFLIGAFLIRRVPDISTEGGGRKFELSSIVEGFKFLKDRRVIQAAFLIDLNAMVFGMPTALFPAIGTEVLGGDAFTVGLLYAAPGAGALIGALTSGWVSAVSRQGRAVVFSVIGWGLAMAVFGLTSSLALALTMLALAGGADVVSAIFRGTIVQLSVPDALRGRLSSMHMAVVAGGPRLGDLEAGVVAAVTSVRFSVVSGGLACVLGALAIARWAPEFVHYRHDPASPDSPGTGLPAPASP
jgi:MFS family permease